MRYLLKEADRSWAENTYSKILAKMSAECDRIGSRIPYAGLCMDRTGC